VLSTEQDIDISSL